MIEERTAPTFNHSPLLPDSPLSKWKMSTPSLTFEEASDQASMESMSPAQGGEVNDSPNEDTRLALSDTHNKLLPVSLKRKSPDLSSEEEHSRGSSSMSSEDDRNGIYVHKKFRKNPPATPPKEETISSSQNPFVEGQTVRDLIRFAIRDALFCQRDTPSPSDRNSDSDTESTNDEGKVKQDGVTFKPIELAQPVPAQTNEPMPKTETPGPSILYTILHGELPKLVLNAKNKPQVAEPERKLESKLSVQQRIDEQKPGQKVLPQFIANLTQDSDKRDRGFLTAYFNNEIQKDSNQGSGHGNIVSPKENNAVADDKNRDRTSLKSSSIMNGNSTISQETSTAGNRSATFPGRKPVDYMKGKTGCVTVRDLLYDVISSSIYSELHDTKDKSEPSKSREAQVQQCKPARHQPMSSKYKGKVSRPTTRLDELNNRRTMFADVRLDKNVHRFAGNDMPDVPKQTLKHFLLQKKCGSLTNLTDAKLPAPYTGPIGYVERVTNVQHSSGKPIDYGQFNIDRNAHFRPRYSTDKMGDLSPRGSRYSSQRGTSSPLTREVNRSHTVSSPSASSPDMPHQPVKRIDCDGALDMRVKKTHPPDHGIPALPREMDGPLNSKSFVDFIQRERGLMNANARPSSHMSHLNKFWQRMDHADKCYQPPLDEAQSEYIKELAAAPFNETRVPPHITDQRSNKASNKNLPPLVHINVLMNQGKRTGDLIQRLV